MVQTLKTYLRRLTNLTARNRSLVLTTLPAEQFLDVHDLDFLDGKPSFEVVSQLIAQKPVVPLCDVLDPRYERLNAVSTRLKRIARTEAFIREERGAEDLYVGYPVVRGKFADGTVVRGPLVFFPVTLAVQRQKWVLRRREEPPFLNPSFLLAYAHFNGVKLPDELLEKTFAESTERDALTFRTQLYELLKGSPLQLNFNPDLFSPHLLPFERMTKGDLEQLEKTGELKLYPQAVLGIFPQAGSYLVPDYEQLILRSEEESEGLTNLFEKLPRGGPLTPRSSLLAPKEADTLLPFAVDASQEAAIRRVKGGESLVIQGPPGTGKSQVIANLMADFAARGKRVLLVCQKRAALDTVYARLRQIGLGDFAALIHDFQHDRAPLYAQLAGQIDRLDSYRQTNQSLDAIFLQREFTQAARRIEQLTTQLQEFRDALFDETACGASAKELYLTSGPDGPRVDLGEHFRAFRFGEIDDFLRRLGQWETYQSRLATSPWHPERVDFSRFASRDVAHLEEAVRDMPTASRFLVEQTAALLGQPLAWDEALAVAQAHEGWREALRQADDAVLWPFLQNFLDGTWSADLPVWLDQQRDALDALWQGGLVGASVPTAALPDFQRRLDEALDARRNVVGWWFFREKEPLRAEASHHGLTLNADDLLRLRGMVENRLRWEKTLVDVETRTGERLLTDDLATTQRGFWEVLKKINRAQQAWTALNTQPLLPDLARRFPDRTAFRRVVTDLLETVGPLPESLRHWRGFLTDRQIETLRENPTAAEPLLATLRRDFELLREMDALRNEFRPVEWEVVKKIQSHSVTSSLHHSVLNSLRLAWLDELESRFPALRSVSGLQMEQWEGELQAAIERKQTLSREILLMHLREQTYQNVERNRLNNVVTYRDLKHQVTKKRLVWPVRKLLSALSEGVFQLVPCWLASPESVSALFPLHPLPPEGGSLPPRVNPLQGAGSEAGGTFFDLVIFDEASQCFAEQGIPALARGQQVVIAGDRQQLQPSDVYRVRFEEGTDDNPDLEVDSLLDLAARYLPQTVLRGHYRSRSLDLIQFSNRHFYGDALRLLPDFAEINRREPAIRYRRVEGEWKDQQNEVEAQAVLDLLGELARTEPELSVGVVTFNYRQQNLIQDLLESRPLPPQGGLSPTAKPPLEGAGGEGHEPLFIKNIENVQGDERDVIIFSIGYAPDARGRVSAQFGSLNAKGGENRLNVAVTRARRRVYVVCSLWPEQLKVEKTLHEGPKLLKAYLKFALDVSGGRFKPTPMETGALRGRPLLKEKLRAEQPELREELPFADLTEKSGETYQNLILTDDEAYFASLSPKEPHAYLPLTLRAKGWPFRRAWSREWWRTATNSVLHRNPVVLLLLGVVLAEGVALPVFGEEKAAQVGVAYEVHAHQIVGFALVPVGGAPDSADGRHFGQFAVGAEAWHPDFERQVVLVGNRVEHVGDVECACFRRSDARAVIQRGDAFEQVEIRPFVFVQKPADFGDALGGHEQVGLERGGVFGQDEFGAEAGGEQKFYFRESHGQELGKSINSSKNFSPTLAEDKLPPPSKRTTSQN
jgi:hypothetical protein